VNTRISQPRVSIMERDCTGAARARSNPKLLLLVVLNPADDRFSREICKVFFSASHVVLAVWAGYGLVLVGVLLGSRGRDRARQPSRSEER